MTNTIHRCEKTTPLCGSRPYARPSRLGGVVPQGVAESEGQLPTNGGLQGSVPWINAGIWGQRTLGNPKMVISHAPSRFPKCKFVELLFNMLLRVSMGDPYITLYTFVYFYSHAPLVIRAPKALL